MIGCFWTPTGIYFSCVVQTLTDFTVHLQVAVQHEVGEETPENRTKSVVFFHKFQENIDIVNGIEHAKICENHHY